MTLDKKIVESVTSDSVMSWNGLTLAHYVGCITKLTVTGPPGTLPNIMGRCSTFHSALTLLRKKN
jgi:hypothetical protein